MHPRTWWEDDPDRLALEIEDVTGVAPGLVWTATGAGHFTGPLPVWPFSRPAPAGVEQLADRPMQIRVIYSHAFPASPPMVFPLDPQPSGSLRSYHEYHVLPNGGLCLLRDADQWDLTSRTSELLLKACGWAIEFALFQRGAIQRMTPNGIVESAQLDDLVASTVGDAS